LDAGEQRLIKAVGLRIRGSVTPGETPPGGAECTVAWVRDQCRRAHVARHATPASQRAIRRISANGCLAELVDLGQGRWRLRLS